MWLKRRKVPSVEVPHVRDEYKRLLNDTLPEVAPLQDVTQSARSVAARPSYTLQIFDSVEKTAWQEHQRALRPHQAKAIPRQIPASQSRRDDTLVPTGRYAMS